MIYARTADAMPDVQLFFQGHRGEVTTMRISPIVLLLFAMLGCDSGTQPAKPHAESGGNQAQQQKVATPEKQAASPAPKTPPAKTPDADFHQDRSLAPRMIVLESVKPLQRDDSSAVRYGLTRKDLERLISTLPNIQQAVPVSTTNRDARHGDKTIAARVVGSTRRLAHVFQLEIARGRFLTDRDRGTMVAVIGTDVGGKLYPVENPIGKIIHIDDHFFRIVGQTKARKTSLKLPRGIKTSTDSDVYIPTMTMRQRFGDRVTTSRPGSRQVEEVELSQIWITVTNLHDVDDTAAIIKSLLEKFHKNKDYSITLGTR